MQRSSRRMIKGLEPEFLEVAEISGKWGRRFNFRSYRQFRLPKHDICAGVFTNGRGKTRQFDLILANQVWEHLDRPYAASQNVLRMLRPGGYFWVAVPFFIPFHAAPTDNSRWSARGLKNLLIEAGFDEHAIQSRQWGNRNAALRNMEEEWPPIYVEGEDPLDNDPDMPVCAWALAQKI
ncbi:MAG: methyltransferase domain-containing protein [Paracoccaceae bacterium]